MTSIVSHRGIDATGQCKAEENTRASLSFALNNGLGIEFDPAFTSDGEIVVIHDANASRISGGICNLPISHLDYKQLKNILDPFGGLLTLREALTLIENHQISFNALHIKSALQTHDKLLKIHKVLSEFPEITLKLVIFDLKPDAAAIMKQHNASLLLAPSVAHEYDCKRYGASTGNTLLTIAQSLQFKDLYDWVWLDEWDLKDASGASKELYTRCVFSTFRENSLKIALVTPELHATSPGLLGGECHADALNVSRLMQRIEDILSLQPDLICTDYGLKIKRAIKT